MIRENDKLNTGGHEGPEPVLEFGDVAERLNSALKAQLPESLKGAMLLRRFEGIILEDAAAVEGVDAYHEDTAAVEGVDASGQKDPNEGVLVLHENKRKARGFGHYMPRLLAAAACLAIGFIGVRQMGEKDIVPITPDTASSGTAAAEGEGVVATGYSAIRNTIYKIQSDQGYYYNYATANPSTAGGDMNDGAVKAPMAMPESQMIESGGSSGMMLRGFAGFGTKDVYETNVQEKGIDEADVIKTDGTYLYIYRYNTQSGRHEVRILQASGLRHMSTIDLGSASYDGSLYLDGDRLVLVRTRGGADDISYGENAKTTSQTLAGDVNFTPEAESSSQPGTASTYRASPEVIASMPGYHSQSSIVEVVVYNIRDKASPEKTATYEQDGSYLTSRYTNGVVYTVTNKGVYDRVISGSVPMGRLVPMVGSERTMDIMPAEDIIISDYLAEPNYVTVTATDIRTGERQAKAVLGVANTLYMSENAIYLTATTYNYDKNDDKNRDESYNHTGIIKLSVNKTELSHTAGGRVDGYVDGQFAFSEKNGNLRVATTADTQNGSRNNMYVLDQKLNIIGSLEGLAPGERIYSVRYMGDMGYIVTFKQVDPLFAIDLSDPKKPAVLGELKIPGFSEYLHPIDDKTLLGFGYNTKENQWGGVTTDGLKLSLFDVSDPKNPAETQSYAIGNSGSGSPAISDHKAFMYYPQKSIVGLPVSVYTASAAGYGGESFSGLLLFEVKPTGFKLYGQIASRQPDNAGFGRYESSFEIQRGVYIGDVVYTFSDGCVMSHRLRSGMPKITEYLFDA